MDQKFVPFYSYISSRPPNNADKALDRTLKEYMSEAMPLESDEGMEKRREVLVAVEAIFRKFVKHVAVSLCHMSEEEAEDAGGELRVSGSHRLGVRDVGADIDTICVAPNFVTREHFFDILKKDFMNHPDVSDFNSIETAVVPIMAFDFQEISIDLLFARLSTNRIPKNFDILSDDVLNGIDEATEKSLNGPRVTDMIPKLACKAKDTDGRIVEHDAFATGSGDKDKDNTFLLVLRCVRRWAKKRGLYGNKMGYLGGVNCNLLVAMVCQLFPHASASTLLVLFFRTYAGWAWPKPIQLNCIQPNPQDVSYENRREIWNGAERWFDLMPIITPAYPAMNSSMSVSVHSREVMKSEFSIAYEKCKNVQTALKEEGSSAWGTLFEVSDFFIQYSHYLQINIVGTGDDPESRSWMGYVESRVRGFPQYLEGLPLMRPIHLYPVQSKTDKSDNSVCYFVGFDVDKARFNPDKPLHVDSCAYNFHKMLTDKYKGVMKDGLDFYVDHYPWKKLPREVFEGYGGREKAKELRKERSYGKYSPSNTAAAKEDEKDVKNGDDNEERDGEKKDGEEGDTKDDIAKSGEADDAQQLEILQSRKRCFSQTYTAGNNLAGGGDNPGSVVYTPGDSGSIPLPVLSVADRAKVIATTTTTTTTIAAAVTEEVVGSKRGRAETKKGGKKGKEEDVSVSDSEDTLPLSLTASSTAATDGDLHLLSRSRDVHWNLMT